MIKKKNIIIGMGILISTMLVGCSSSSDTSNQNINEASNVEFVPVVELELESDNLPSKIKTYKKLEVDSKRDSEDNITYIKLISDTAKDISLTKAEDIKSLLGDDLELVPYDEIAEGEESIYYYLKGYESVPDAKEQKAISLTLQDKLDSYTPPVMGIYFITKSNDLSQSLKEMLSMEDKISLAINNLLEKDEADEILRFLKEEISRINAEKDSHFDKIENAVDNKPLYTKSTLISINDDISIGITVIHNGESYDVSCGIVSSSLMKDWSPTTTEPLE